MIDIWGKAECTFRTIYYRALEAYSVLIKSRSSAGKPLSVQLIKYTGIGNEEEKANLY